MRTDTTRRQFLAVVPAVLAAPTLLGAAVGCATKQTDAAKGPAVIKPEPTGPRIAIIGCAGRGGENLGDLLGAGASVVALCDVEAGARESGSKRVASAAVYTDLRQLCATAASSSSMASLFRP